MKKLLTIVGLAAALTLLSGASTLAFGQDKPAAEAAKAEDKKDAAPVAASPAAAAAPDAKEVAKPAEASPPKLPEPNKGDFTFMYVATILVILMIIPGLALFYGGLEIGRAHV